MARPYQRNPRPGRTGTTSHQGRAGLRQLPSVHPAAGLDLRVPSPGRGGRRGYDSALAAEDIELIRRADTFFLGTTHPERGSDVSHRGGPPGFACVDGDQLWWPDYARKQPVQQLRQPRHRPRNRPPVPRLHYRPHPPYSPAPPRSSGANPASHGDDGHTGRRVRFTLQLLVAGHLLAARETAHEPLPAQPRSHRLTSPCADGRIHRHDRVASGRLPRARVTDSGQARTADRTR